MPSSYTGNLRFTKQGIGENDSTWGVIANTQYDLTDEAISGITTVSVTTGVDYTLSTNNGATDEARKAILKLNGTPIADINVIVPAVSKVYYIDGSTFAGAYKVTIKPAAGTGVTFSAGQNGIVICDGANIKEIYRTVPAFVTGMILMWSGTISTIPAGWNLCDGTNGTPDLRDRFVVGATQDNLSEAKTNITGSLTKSGGSTDTQDGGAINQKTSGTALTINQLPKHKFTYQGVISIVTGDQNGGSGLRGINLGDKQTNELGNDQTHDHDMVVAAHKHVAIPPYFALAFIMKV